jgi:hypothetical protein
LLVLLFVVVNRASERSLFRPAHTEHAKHRCEMSSIRVPCRGYSI